MTIAKNTMAVLLASSLALGALSVPAGAASYRESGNTCQVVLSANEHKIYRDTFTMIGKGVVAPKIIQTFMQQPIPKGLVPVEIGVFTSLFPTADDYLHAADTRLMSEKKKEAMKMRATVELVVINNQAKCAGMELPYPEVGLAYDQAQVDTGLSTPVVAILGILGSLGVLGAIFYVLKNFAPQLGIRI